MKKASLPLFLVFMVMLQSGANIAHPFTPQLFINLNQPDYMFGLSYSLMSLTAFLFAPTWGKISDSVGRIKMLPFTIAGYALGQLVFSIATNEPTIIFARLLAGFFAGGNNVMAISYVADISSDKIRGKNMSIFAALNSVSAAIGFLIGGEIADYSIRVAFNVQVGLLLLTGLLVGIFIKDTDKVSFDNTAKVKIQNPFRSFKDAKCIMNVAMTTFLITVFVSAFATQSYDNAFNYFIKAEFGFPPSYNGMIKAIIGIIGLVANFTINFWIVKHTNWRKSIVGIFGLCTASVIIVIFCESIYGFIISSIMFYIFNSIYIPLQQSILTKNSHGSNGIAVGMFQSFMSMGKVLGPLFSGIIYAYGSKLPFIFSGFAFTIAMILSIINLTQYNKIKQY